MFREVLDATVGNEIPKEVIAFNKKIIIKAHISASVIVVILMNVKPFLNLKKATH